MREDDVRLLARALDRRTAARYAALWRLERGAELEDDEDLLGELERDGLVEDGEVTRRGHAFVAVLRRALLPAAKSRGRGMESAAVPPSSARAGRGRGSNPHLTGPRGASRGNAESVSRAPRGNHSRRDA